MKRLHGLSLYSPHKLAEKQVYEFDDRDDVVCRDDGPIEVFRRSFEAGIEAVERSLALLCSRIVSSLLIVVCRTIRGFV